MATTPVNALNISQAGLVKFDGTATFTGVTTTNHNVLIGATSNGITNVAPSATSGVPLISQGASADPIFGTALIAGGGTGSTSFNINGVVISGTTTTSALTSLTLTSGQVVIGGSTTPAAATLTAGSGISIANGNNSITITATGGAFTWSETSGSFSAAASNGYFITTTATATLPASPAEGDTIAFVLDTTNILTINAGTTSQVIRIGNQVSKTNTGSVLSNSRGDSIMLTYESTGTAWYARSVTGTWSLTTS